jgi:hypothetical protein
MELCAIEVGEENIEEVPQPLFAPEAPEELPAMVVTSKEVRSSIRRLLFPKSTIKRTSPRVLAARS